MVKNGRAEFRSFQNHSEYLPMVKNGAVLVKERDAIEHTMYADYLQKAREGVAEADRYERKQNYRLYKISKYFLFRSNDK